MDHDAKNEFSKNLPLALDVAQSTLDPTIPCRTPSSRPKPFYLNVAEMDPQKGWNRMSDFRFAYVAMSAGRCKSDQDWDHAEGEQCVDRL